MHFVFKCKRDNFIYNIDLLTIWHVFEFQILMRNIWEKERFSKVSKLTGEISQKVELFNKPQSIQFSIQIYLQRKMRLIFFPISIGCYFLYICLVQSTFCYAGNLLFVLSPVKDQFTSLDRQSTSYSIVISTKDRYTCFLNAFHRLLTHLPPTSY